MSASSETNVAYVTAVRFTIGLRKIRGQWTVMHEHHSIPAT